MLDANVLASGALASEGAVADIVTAWLIERRIGVVVSGEILVELQRALAKPYFRRRLTPSDLERYVAAVRGAAQLAEPATDLGAVPVERSDAHVLALALDSHVDYLVSGDRRLVDLRSFRGLPIVTPRELVAVL